MLGVEAAFVSAFVSVVETAMERVLDRKLHLLPRAPAGAADDLADLVLVVDVIKQEVASERSMREWIRTGQLKRYGKPRATKVKRSELMALLEAQGRAGNEERLSPQEQAAEILKKRQKRG